MLCLGWREVQRKQEAEARRSTWQGAIKYIDTLVKFHAKEATDKFADRVATVDKWDTELSGRRMKMGQKVHRDLVVSALVHLTRHAMAKERAEAKGTLESTCGWVLTRVKVRVKANRMGQDIREKDRAWKTMESGENVHETDGWQNEEQN